MDTERTLARRRGHQWAILVASMAGKSLMKVRQGMKTLKTRMESVLGTRGRGGRLQQVGTGWWAPRFRRYTRHFLLPARRSKKLSPL